MADSNAVALAAIALASTTIGGLIWLAKYVVKTLGKDLQEHTVASTKLAKASEEQKKASQQATKASKEVLQFMKELNGKLSKATSDTIKERRKR